MSPNTNNTTAPIITTGLSGLVGSKLEQVYGDAYSFVNLDIADKVQPVDITNQTQVFEQFAQHQPKFVVHLAAFTNVTAAWEQRDQKDGLAYQVNVVGTENIVQACQKFGAHLIHVSTAFVFDGKKEGFYSESDSTSPIEWYGKTKALAEEIVLNSDIPATVLRIDFPFRSDPFPRPDIVRKTIATIEAGVPLFNNHFFGPTYIDDFVKVIDWVVRTGQTGLFNASSGEKWTDYAFGKVITEILGLKLDVAMGDLDTYLQTLSRPYQRNTALNASKLKAAIDFELKGIEQALHSVRL